MTLTIGSVDLTPYIAYQGVKWQRSDLDSEEAGRTLDGVMHRDRVASKRRLDVTLRPVTTSEASTILSAIAPEWVSVTFTDPETGSDVTKTMYSNNIPATYCVKKGSVDYWSGITFPLIEQ